MPPVQCATTVSDFPPVSAFGLRPAWTALAAIRAWLARGRQRRQLAELEDHRLQDVGITREEALAEAGKPFWRA
jgi:uncharacterized protein YjiS (DUF1127 family)